MNDLRTSSMMHFLQKMIILGKLPPFTNKPFIDIGSGNGFGIHIIRALGGIPLGIEIDQKKVTAAHTSGIKQEEPIHADATAFLKKSPESMYDGVTLFLAPLYDGSFIEVIRRLERVLKSNAIVILTTPTPIEMELAAPILQEINIIGKVEWHSELSCDKYVFIGRKG